MLHAITLTHSVIMTIFGSDVLIEYTIERWFVIQHLLTNVSALPGETRTLFSYAVYRVSKMALLQFAIFDIH